tara:strand:- start:361 stop:768 length:408 start_codon:yes stop_codon:yes gene_type:complete
MHLLGPMWTTTKYTSKRKKNKNQRELLAKVEHDKWLKKMGAHPSQRSKIGDKCYGSTAGSNPVREGSIPSSSAKPFMTVGNLTSKFPVGNLTSKRKENFYTGDQLVGVATLHKSNMVPVRKDSNDAKEIARMRRG